MGTGPVLALGVPTAGAYSFMIERALNLILPEAEPRVREVLAELDCIEAQLSEVKRRLGTSRVDNLHMRPREEIEDLEDLFLHWCDVLSDITGIGPNPFSFRHRRMGTGHWQVVNPC